MKIIVLAGGNSPERNVSFISGIEVTKALRKKGHECFWIYMKEQIVKTFQQNINIP